MRSTLTPLFVCGALAAAVGAASADPATVTATTPMHARPGMRSAVVAMIPANAPIDVGACGAWCRVEYGRAVGFVPSPLIVAAGPAPAYYGAAAPAYDYGPLGLVAAPFEAVGGVVGGVVNGVDAYGAAPPPEAPPVMAAY